MKKILIKTISISLAALHVSHAHAHAQEQTAPKPPTPAHVKEVARDTKNIAACVMRRDALACREYVTDNSKELFNRFVAYGLMDCLPEEGYYVNHELQDGYAQTRIHMNIGDSAFAADLYLRKQNDTWKLDVPHTFKQGMGEHWEKHITAIEQGYVFMKRYMGDKLNCSAVRQLVGGGENAAN